MKNLLFLLLCLCSFAVSAQQGAMSDAHTAKGDAPAAAKEGMVFLEKPFADLLAQAKAEDKVIFIDAYTTWCGPCKMMAKNVFPAKEVGKVYNERFINAKIDMEKGEGPEIAKRYSVMAYPTYLFVDGNGDIVHKGIGYIPQEEFLALADAASGDESLGKMNQRYAAGDRSGEFLRNYADVLTNVYEQDNANKVAGEYLALQKDWNTPATLQLLAANPGELGGKRMAYLVANSEAAMKEVGANTLLMTLQQALITSRMQELGVRALPAPEEMSATYKLHGGALNERLAAHYAMFRASRMNDTEAYVPAAVAYFNAYGSDDAGELNSAAWTVYESSDDPAHLAAALEWAKQSVAIKAGYPNMDTLAWLYLKTGDKKMARETANAAIKLAKLDGQDYSETAKILEED